MVTIFLSSRYTQMFAKARNIGDDFDAKNITVPVVSA